MYNDILRIENARIMYRNFEGKESKFNAAGNRNFCVIIDDVELAQQLNNDGWNVKVRPPREEGDEPLHYIKVNVSFKFKPPKIVSIAGGRQTILDEETVAALDYQDILNVDLEIRPYNWENANGTGVSGYLKTMYVTVDEDSFASKYAAE